MKIFLHQSICLLVTLFVVVQRTSPTEAGEALGFTVHAAEIGIGKFHRFDNKVHPYEQNNIWGRFILPENASLTQTSVVENKDGSVSIFFSSLESLIEKMEEVANRRHQVVEVLNLNAHGMPGAMWFPKDEATRTSDSCGEWMKAAQGDDKANYDQYYSPVSKLSILIFRLFSKLPSIQWLAPCTTGASQFKEIMSRHPNARKIFAADAQIHLFSCIVGLGWAGRRMLSRMAPELLTGENAKLEASMNFGLGDWSMPEGMGFWDYQNTAQLNHDNERYPVDRKDRDMMQKGEVRLITLRSEAWTMGIVSPLDFMLGTKDSLQLSSDTVGFADEQPLSLHEMGLAEQLREIASAKNFDLRIPGTNAPIKIHFWQW